MPTKSYQDDLLKRLARPAYAAAYLKAAFDETQRDGDMEAFQLALRNVIDAHGSVQEIAEEARITRQHLHNLLASADANPTLQTLTAVLQSVGLTLDFTPAH